VRVNDAFCAMLGYSQEQLAVRALNALRTATMLVVSQMHAVLLLRVTATSDRREKRYVARVGATSSGLPSATLLNPRPRRPASAFHLAGSGTSASVARHEEPACACRRS